MSLDNFFDKMDGLGKRKRVEMPCSFVKTVTINKIKLPKGYAELVNKYYPECLVVAKKNSIEVLG